MEVGVSKFELMRGGGSEVVRSCWMFVVMLDLI